MQITTRTAVIPMDAIQTAYNDAVMSGRMALAREIEQLWLSRLAKQKVVPLARQPIAFKPCRSRSRAHCNRPVNEALVYRGHE